MEKDGLISPHPPIDDMIWLSVFVLIIATSGNYRMGMTTVITGQANGSSIARTIKFIVFVAVVYVLSN